MNINYKLIKKRGKNKMLVNNILRKKLIKFIINFLNNTNKEKMYLNRMRI